MKISKNIKFSFKFYSKNNIIIKKKSYNNIINYSKKKNNKQFNILSYLNNFKPSYILIAIKKKISNYYIGIYKDINGFIFLNKLSNGVFLGDIFKTSFIPLKLLKFNSLNSYTFLKNLNIYSIFNNIIINKNYYISKSSGTYCQLLEIKNNINLAIIKIPSGKKMILNSYYFCLTGRNSNLNKKYEINSKASFNINLGKKPVVRGVAKNPIDHPHGGRTKTNQPEVSPWGWITKNSH